MNNSTTPRRGQQRDKPFRDALRMEAALAERSEPTPAPPGSLRSIGRNLLDRADKCTLAAREVADRLDGKPGQALEMQTEVVQRVARKPMTREEWAARYCEKSELPTLPNGGGSTAD